MTALILPEGRKGDISETCYAGDAIWFCIATEVENQVIPDMDTLIITRVNIPKERRNGMILEKIVSEGLSHNSYIIASGGVSGGHRPAPRL